MTEIRSLNREAVCIHPCIHPVREALIPWRVAVREKDTTNQLSIEPLLTSIRLIGEPAASELGGGHWV